MPRHTGKGDRKLSAMVSYRCARCNRPEEIPADVIEHFDLIDPGLPGQPATFRCRHCPGIMYPIRWFEHDAASVSPGPRC